MLTAASRPRDLAAGLLLSLGVHALLLGGLAGAGVMVAAPGPEAVLTTLLPEEIAPPPEVVPGNGAADIDTTNWLGVDAPKEQRAPKSEVEQPELSINPGAPSTNVAPPAPQPAPPATAALPPPVAESAPDGSPHAAKPTEADARAAQPPAVDVPLATVALPTPAPAAGAAAPPQPGAGAGLRSTSESAAAALKDAVGVVPGRVVSAKGLRIETKRPDWAATTRAIRNPGNAVMQVTFARDGTAREVRFLSDGKREYRTGYADVDEPLVTALYQWTARGEALLRLPEDDPDAGVTITFKILLTRG